MDDFKHTNHAQSGNLDNFGEKPPTLCGLKTIKNKNGQKTGISRFMINQE